MEVNPIFKFFREKPKLLLALAPVDVDVGVPAQVLVDGDAKVICGNCGLKRVAMELVGVLKDIPGCGNRQYGALLWVKGYVFALLSLSKPLEVLLQLLMVFRCLYHIVFIYCSVISKQPGW